MSAMTENRKQDARSEAEPAQTSGPPSMRSAHTPAGLVVYARFQFRRAFFRGPSLPQDKLKPSDAERYVGALRGSG